MQVFQNSGCRVSSTSPTRLDILVQGVNFRAVESFPVVNVHDMDIEWCSESAALTVTADGHPQTVKARSVIIHEPMPHLYQALPLARFDEKARRFWYRVFRLVRIPGGRHLLKLVSRRRRDRP